MNIKRFLSNNWKTLTVVAAGFAAFAFAMAFAAPLIPVIAAVTVLGVAPFAFLAALHTFTALFSLSVLFSAAAMFTVGSVFAADKAIRGVSKSIGSTDDFDAIEGVNSKKSSPYNSSLLRNKNANDSKITEDHDDDLLPDPQPVIQDDNSVVSEDDVQNDINSDEEPQHSDEPSSRAFGI